MEDELEHAIATINIKIDGVAIEQIQNSIFTNESFWFSWIILDKPYKSEPFKLCDLSNYHFQHAINHKYSFRPKKLVSMIPKEILKDFPLKVYLCSENYFKQLGTINPFLDIENDFHFPISTSEYLEIPDDSTMDEITNLLRENNVLSKFKIDITTDTQYDEIESSNITLIKKVTQENIAPEPEYTQTESFLRHYRLSIDIKSVKGLKRPYRASFQYSYPYLGSFNLVRTPLGWYHSNSETRVEKGATFFEYVTTKVKFREVIEKNYLDIKFVERSTLGDKKAGVSTIHLINIFDSTPHSYRCPVSGKLFQTMEEYEFYFDQCAQLYNSGELAMAPSREPEYLFVKDLYIPIYEISYNDGNRETITTNVIGTMRMVLIIEDKGKVGRETPVNIQPGYVMHKGGLYDKDSDPQNLNFTEKEGNNEPSHDEVKFSEYTRLQEWELWRQKAELEWKNTLQEKEIALREKIRQEEESKLSNKSDDLRRAQIEIGKLQVRLKTSIEAVERQQMLLKNQEEQLTLRVNQKLQEMQLLARRVKGEARASIDAERLKSQNIENQNAILQEKLKEMEKKAKQAEEDFDNFKIKHRLTSEFLLTEEIAVVKAQLSAAYQQNEEEKKLRALAIAEKEQFRSQVHRLAQALKREKEKNNVLARQELEQLRLEFLAREERYVLDGDRSLLNTIRQDLAMLRTQI